MSLLMKKANNAIMCRQTRSRTVAPNPTDETEISSSTPSKTVRFAIRELDAIQPKTTKQNEDIAPPSITGSTRTLRPRSKSTPPEALEPPTPAPTPQQPRQRKKLTPKKPGPAPKLPIIKKSAAAKKAETKRLAATRDLSLLREARRNELKAQQAEQEPEKTALEPNLNDSREVRWFEVDEKGSLTLIVLALERDVEVWIMEEVAWDGGENGERKDLEGGFQVVCGRWYRVTRV